MKILLFFMILSINCFSEEIKGYWMTQEGKNNMEAVVYIDKKNQNYSGIIKYIAIVDKEFNIKSLKTEDEIIGFELVRDFVKVDENIYKKGRIIDPETLKVYYASFKIEGNNLILRGSLDSHGILGAKRIWKRVKVSEK